MISHFRTGTTNHVSTFGKGPQPMMPTTLTPNRGSILHTRRRKETPTMTRLKALRLVCHLPLLQLTNTNLLFAGLVFSKFQYYGNTPGLRTRSLSSGGPAKMSG